MSFDSRLFPMGNSMPQKKRNGNGKKLQVVDKRCFGDECFRTDDFFGGFMAEGGGQGIKAEVPPIDQGLPIPELGAEYNTRFSKIGTGFTEAVNPYDIGFKDIITGNGRTGEIITGGTEPKRGRGRPRKEKTIEQYVGGYSVGKLKGKRGKYPELKTKEVREREAKGEKVETKSKTVATLLKESIRPKPQFESTKVKLGKGAGQYVQQSKVKIYSGEGGQ